MTLAAMTPTEFNATMIICFVAVVIVVWVGFYYFLKWRRGVISHKPTHEQLAQRAAAIDAKFKLTHPDLDEPEA
jgi:Na+/H+ antiporter NhaD/arsenite permease-like protein